MNYSATAAPAPSNTKNYIALITIGLLMAGGYLYMNQSAGEASKAAPTNTGAELGIALSPQARDAWYHHTVDRGKHMAATWPKTDADVVRSFWFEVMRGNMDGAILYSPGTTTKDLTPYTQYVPLSFKSVGTSYPHPTEKDITMMPIVVEFPGVPNKELTMAMMTLPDGRRAIHGGYSIWW